jgi:UDP-N-acetyl-2-amino-2-deoxyglucuronate dehydrogenase
VARCETEGAISELARRVPSHLGFVQSDHLCGYCVVERVISVGLVGCGDIADRYGREISTSLMNKLRLDFVTDVNEEQGRAFARKYSTEFVRSLEEMLSRELDLICVCTPNRTHAKIALECLMAKRHVLIEHPLAMTTSDARNIISASQQHACEVFVTRQRRFSRSIQLLRRALKQYMVKRVELKVFWNRRGNYFSAKSWRSERDGGGVILNQASHFLDILIYLFGEPVKQAGRFGNIGHQVACEDSVIGRLELKNGAIAKFQCTTAAPEGVNVSSLLVEAENGIYEVKGRDLDELSCPDSFALSDDFLDKTLFTGDHRGYLGRVARRLNGERDLEIVDAVEGARTVRFIESIYAGFRRDDAGLRAEFNQAFVQWLP